MELTRRSFLAGIGSASVTLLFARRLDRVIDELSAESAAELVAAPATADQLAAAAEIVVQPQQAFRPERLIISGTEIGKRMVPVKEWKPCAACGDPYVDDLDAPICAACDGDGGELVGTGELREESVMEVPWVIDDIVIGKQSQLCQAGALPGDLFAADAIDAFVRLDTAGPAAEIRFRVRYVGDKPEGEVFRAALIGPGRDRDGGLARLVLPIMSQAPIARDPSYRFASV